MIKYSNSADAIFRTDYKKIIERFKKLFDKKKYLILIYEELEKKDIFKKLDENLKEEIAPLFIDTYKYCAKKVPETKKY
tara:strand:- start:367 stop:603 length:237 start_codon:yes stop_codon:yes gene_type:complete